MVDTFRTPSFSNKKLVENKKKEFDGFFDFKNQYVNSCLLGAVNSGLPDEVEKWVKAGANVNYIEFISHHTPLLNASCICNYEISKLLIENGANVNYVNAVGWTPVSIAADNGDHKIVKLLLENGASSTINHKDILRNSPLHKAIRKGSLETVKLLVEHGADLTCSVIVACTYNHKEKVQKEIIDYLIEKGAEISFVCVFDVGLSRYLKQFKKE